MSYAMHMRWPGIGIDEYEQVRDIVRWEEDAPDGGLFHVSAYDGEALRVFDVWESPDKLQAFMDSRLMPAVQRVGVTSEPEVTVCKVHRTWVPQSIAAGAGTLA